MSQLLWVLPFPELLLLPLGTLVVRAKEPPNPGRHREIMSITSGEGMNVASTMITEVKCLSLRLLPSSRGTHRDYYVPSPPFMAPLGVQGPVGPAKQQGSLLAGLLCLLSPPRETRVVSRLPSQVEGGVDPGVGPDVVARYARHGRPPLGVVGGRGVGSVGPRDDAHETWWVTRDHSPDVDVPLLVDVPRPSSSSPGVVPDGRRGWGHGTTTANM